MDGPHDSAAFPDDALVRAVAEGSEQALGALYDRHVSLAYGLALRIVREPADAEEVVADAFLQLWRSAPDFDPERGPVPIWVAMIVRSRALDLVRSRKRRARAMESSAARSAEGLSAPLSRPAPAPDRSLELDEVRALVEACLAELSGPQREALELSFFGGLSHREIAATLDEPLGTVKTRIRTAMHRLRDALRPVLRRGAP